MRLFAEFYQADVIIASPLGLATALSAAAAEGAGGADFLSSIEIAVVDRADVMLMQNWAHVSTGAGCDVWMDTKVPWFNARVNS